MVGKSTAWVSQRLKLVHLCREARQSMLAGKLNLGKAVALTRVKYTPYQIELLPHAEGMRNREFELFIGEFVNRKRAEQSKEPLDEEQVFKPRLQSIDNILIELDRLEHISEQILKKNLTNATEGAILALEWVLNLHEAGRKKRIDDSKHKLNSKERVDIIGRRRYEELGQLRKLREQRQQQLSQKEEQHG